MHIKIDVNSVKQAIKYFQLHFTILKDFPPFLDKYVSGVIFRLVPATPESRQDIEYAVISNTTKDIWLLMAVFQLRILHTYVHAREIVNASAFLTFNI